MQSLTADCGFAARKSGNPTRSGVADAKTLKKFQVRQYFDAVRRAVAKHGWRPQMSVACA
jgi:hypothetical protein